MNYLREWDTRVRLPEQVIRDRRPILRRTLRGLPDRHLAALVKGLSAHCDELVPGRLFDARGGCAVGVMLRELDPERYAPGRWRYLLRERWRRSVGSDWDLKRAFPRLVHLEMSFDRSVKIARNERPELSDQEAAREVGRWFLAEARREVALRERAAGALIRARLTGERRLAVGLGRQAKDPQAA
jgi:hypothetical protein